MPITIRIRVRWLSQAELDAIAYEVMEHVDAKSPVRISFQQVGEQPIRLINPGVAFKITGLDRSLGQFEVHGYLRAAARFRPLSGGTPESADGIVLGVSDWGDITC